MGGQPGEPAHRWTVCCDNSVRPSVSEPAGAEGGRPPHLWVGHSLFLAKLRVVKHSSSLLVVLFMFLVYLVVLLGLFFKFYY